MGQSANATVQTRQSLSGSKNNGTQTTISDRSNYNHYNDSSFGKQSESAEQNSAMNHLSMLQRTLGNHAIGALYQTGHFAQRSPSEQKEEPQGKLTQLEEKDDKAEEEPQGKLIQLEEKDEKAEEEPQTKMTIGSANDKYEREADSMADKVLSMPMPNVKPGKSSADGAIQKKPLSYMITPLKRNRASRKESHFYRTEHVSDYSNQFKIRQAGKFSSNAITKVGADQFGNQQASQRKTQTNGGIQRKGAYVPNVTPQTESQITQSRGRGKELAPDTREYMEGRFGADFSGVRVHTGSQGAELSTKMNAHAFTLGNDIYFNQGKYNPDSADGKRLLAHELTHTVQQGASARIKSSPISQTQRSIQRWSIKGIINKILSFIPGFTLVTVFLGKNPVTGDKVPQTGKMLMKGATELIPVVGPILWGELEESGSAEKAGKWLDGKMKKLGLSIGLIKRLIDKAWDEMSIWKGIDGNKAVIKRIFGPYLGKTISLIRSIKEKVREFIIEGILMMAGAMGVQVWNVLRKDPKALKRILDKPVIIVKNFFKGVKLGFDKFGTNFVKHFKNAVMEWVFGTMGEAGLQLPAKFNMAGIFSIVMQVLGLTYGQIRARVVIGLSKMVGPEKAEKAIGFIEKGVDFVKRIITEGPIALWDMVKEKIGDLKQMVLGKIVEWARNTIIKKAILKLVSMLNPAGAVFQAIMMVYDVIMFFIKNWDRITAIVTGIFNSIAIAALGQTGKIGKYIEGILAKGMTVLIAFLARLIGLGGIAKKVQDIIAKIRAPITKAIDKVVGVILKLAKPIIAAISKGTKKVSAAVDKAKQKGKDAVSAVKEKGKAVVGKIKALIFPKKSLKVGSESHTISSEPKGKQDEIVLRSKRMSITDFIKYAKDNGYTETEKLDNLNSEYNKWTKMPKDTEAQRKAKLTEYTDLLKKTEIIWKGIPVDTDIPASNISWGPVDGKGRATSVKADPLTIKGVGGSPPSESIPGYTSGAMSSGRPKIYEKSRIKAHLLHHDMHGPGKGFNLTPTSNYLNRFSMFPIVEKPALHALGIRNYSLSSIKPTKQLVYETKITYEDNRKPPVNQIAKHVSVNVTDKITGKKIAKFSEDNYSDAEAKEMEKEVS